MRGFPPFHRQTLSFLPHRASIPRRQGNGLPVSVPLLPPDLRELPGSLGRTTKFWHWCFSAFSIKSKISRSEDLRGNRRLIPLLRFTTNAEPERMERKVAICHLVWPLHSPLRSGRLFSFQHRGLEGASENSPVGLRLAAFDSVSLESRSHLVCCASDPTSKPR